MIHSYPWYIQEWFLSDTRMSLTLEERALYREILDLLYHHEGVVANNEEILMRKAGVTEKEWKRCWPKVKKHFDVIDNGSLSHPKVREVVEKLVSYHSKRKDAGRNGATKRWGKTDSKAIAQPSEKISSAIKNGWQKDSLINHLSTTYQPQVSEGDPSEEPKPAPTNPEPNANFDFDAEALLSEITKRHPKQEGAALGERLLAQVIAESPDPEHVAKSINERHRKFCEIECAGRERKFVPSLLNWVRDKKYLDPDPISEGGEPVKKPPPMNPDEFLAMALKLRATNERRMAEEQARLAKEQQEWDAQYGQTG